MFSHWVDVDLELRNKIMKIFLLVFSSIYLIGCSSTPAQLKSSYIGAQMNTTEKRIERVEEGVCNLKRMSGDNSPCVTQPQPWGGGSASRAFDRTLGK